MFNSAALYADSSVSFKPIIQTGLSLHQYQDGWRGHNPNLIYTKSDEVIKPAINFVTSMYKPASNSNWFYGIGLDVLLHDFSSVSHSRNRVNFSLINVGYNTSHEYSMIIGAGWSKFFENKDSYGQSFSFELMTPVKLLKYPLSIKYMWANTDYEPRGQGSNAPALRGGSTQNISILLNFK
jgi:hypothetical protein